MVVPGVANKLYAYGLSRLLPPAAVGAFTQVPSMTPSAYHCCLGLYVSAPSPSVSPI